MIGIGIAIECVMIAIMTLGIQRFQSNCHENPGMARDDDNNHEHVTIAITTSGVSRGIVTRIWDCQGDMRISIHLFGKLLRWKETRKTISEMMNHKQSCPGRV